MTPTMYNRAQQNWLPSLFSDLFDYDGLTKLGTTSPAINVIENEKEYRVEMATPGMTKDNFTIRLNDDNQLFISMEKRDEHKEAKKGERYLRQEFSYSKFEQTLYLPEDVRKEDINATVENGVLSISIPKETAETKTAKERLIEIK